jgi:hypothetical protein
LKKLLKKGLFQRAPVGGGMNCRNTENMHRDMMHIPELLMSMFSVAKSSEANVKGV